MIHTFHRTADGTAVTEREAFDANGSLKSGFTMRTKIELMDGEPTFVRDMFASKREQITAYNKRVSDAWRTPDAFNAAPKSESKPKPEEEDPDEEELRKRAAARTDSAYAAYDKRIAQAWKA